jgi:hypothetical protein
MRDHTHSAHAVQRDASGLAGLARQSQAGFGFAKDNNGGRDPASARFNDPSWFVDL